MRPDRFEVVDDQPAVSPSHARSNAAYVVTPDAESAPGVMVLHGWWGLNGFVRRTCDRLAEAGFVAMAPDLFDGRTADRPDQAQALLADMNMDEVVASVLATSAALRELPVTIDRPIGVVGLSMGASLALWLATRAPEQVGATVVFYGSQDIDFETNTAPILGHFAEHDELVSDDQVVEMEAHLRLLGKDVEFHRYAGTGHWFIEEDRPAAYDPGAAQLAWERTLSFLHRHLDP